MDPLSRAFRILQSSSTASVREKARELFPTQNAYDSDSSTDIDLPPFVDSPPHDDDMLPLMSLESIDGNI